MVYKSSTGGGGGGVSSLNALTGGLSLTSTGATVVITPSGSSINLETSAGGGNVNTTGTPASGNLTKFSGATTITNGDLSGDVTTSGTLATTVAKVNGVTYGTSPSTNTVPVVTGVNTVTYEAVPNAALANSSMTIAGHSISLGGTQAIAAADLSNGVTGSGAVVLATSPTLVTPALGTPASGVLTNCTGTASGLTAGNVTTNANLTGAVTSVGNATSLVTGIFVATPSTGALGNATLTFKMPFAGTINALQGAQTTSGSLTLAVNIGGVAVTGLSAVSITSTPADTNATAANTFVAGNIITFVTSAASSDLGATWTLKITRS